MKPLSNLSDSNLILIQEKLLPTLVEALKKFAFQDNFLGQMELVFGSGDYSYWQKAWQQEQLILPSIEIRTSSEINGARGAYSADTNKIYLAEELLTQNDSTAIIKVLLEEYGHYVDAIDGVDAPGDEGEIFAAIVLGETPTASEVKALQGQSDLSVVTLDGQVITIEQAASDLDPIFDLDGKLTTDFGGSDDSATSIAIQADGKLVVAGTSSGNFVLARYLSNGTLDTSFDVDGKLTTDFGSSDEANSAAIQADGKIVVAGRSFNGTNYDFALARYLSDGTLDTSFDVDGKLTTDSGGDDEANSAAIQADGKIVMAGRSSGNFALARYLSDGTLDTSFDVDGKLTTDFGSSDSATSLAIQADGKFVVAGTSSGNFALARYLSDGTLDTSFGVNGKLTTNFRSSDSATSVAIQADSKIVVAGRSFNDTDYDFALARYLSDGTLDTSFDVDGKRTTNFGGDDQANTVAIQADGNIVMAGKSSGNFALARYLSDGTLDTSFDVDGKLTTNFGSSDSATSLAIQADGKFVVAGTSSGNFALARYQGTSNFQSLSLYRFRNKTYSTGTYLFVAQEERDAILANPDFNQTFELEGNGAAAFKASLSPGDGLLPFYRLQSKDVPGTYLFVGPEEYNGIFAPNSEQNSKWVKEGLDASGLDVAEFYLSGVGVNQGIAFSRFQNQANKTFLFAGPEETQAILADPNFSGAFTNQGGAFEAFI